MGCSCFHNSFVFSRIFLLCGLLLLVVVHLRDSNAYSHHLRVVCIGFYGCELGSCFASLVGVVWYLFLLAYMIALCCSFLVLLVYICIVSGSFRRLVGVLMHVYSLFVEFVLIWLGSLRCLSLLSHSLLAAPLFPSLYFLLLLPPRFPLRVFFFFLFGGGCSMLPGQQTCSILRVLLDRWHNLRRAAQVAIHKRVSSKSHSTIPEHLIDHFHSHH